MERNLNFKINSLFKSTDYDKEAETWCFYFNDDISFDISAFWRILINKKIQWVSLDNGHQFGLDKPVDLIEEMKNILTGKSLLEITVKDDTYDLVLNLTDDIKIEIFISSAGYETYEFIINKNRYIGLGSGDIAIIEN